MNPRNPRCGGPLAVLVSCLVMLVPARSQSGTETTPPKQDVVKLKNGNLLEGRIVAEGEKTLTIRVGPGQEIEISKKVVASCTRLSDPDEEPGETAVARWHTRNAWFRLKNADGRLVGKLHLYVRPVDAGCLRLEQQWTFVDAAMRTLVNRIETVDPKLRPLSFLYRETVSERVDDRVRKERVVRGTIQDGKLELEEIASEGRSKRSLPFPEGNSLPMLVEEMLRRGEAQGARSFSASVYDPMEGVFELRRYNLADGVPAPINQRAGRATQARLVESIAAGRVQREWVGKNGQILLLEVNGVHLVAEPIAEQTARALESFDAVKAPPTWRPFGGMHVWLPRASWSFGNEAMRGQLMNLNCSVPGSRVQAWFMKAEPGEFVLQAASEQFLKRWKLDRSWFVERSQERVRLGGRDVVRIDGGGKDETGRLRVGRAFVLESEDGYLVIAADAPAKSWPFLSVEAGELVRSLRAIPDTVAAEPGK